jgi:predicted nucleic acid-binding protein
MNERPAPVVVDASVLIAFLDEDDAHHGAAVAALAAHRTDRMVVPASAYAEILVGPYRRSAAAVATADQFLAAIAATVEPITREIARGAAALRAVHRSLRLPDALVLATADALGAAAVLTADADWPRISPRARII